MNRQKWIVALIIGALTASFGNAFAQTEAPDEVSRLISSADNAVSQARKAIEKGKELVTLIPEDSPYHSEAIQMLQSAFSNWKITVGALEGAKQSASKISSAADSSISEDYELLAKGNAHVAYSGAQVVQIALAYVEAVATNKTESLDLIRNAMQDALAASSQVQFYYEKVKTLISDKYSK